MTAILSLDTSSKFASISVAKDHEIQLEYNFATRDELSATLIPSIEFVLNSSSLKLSDINVFGIGVGPGLFTGIRVGLATLKGLILAEPKPVIPVITLEALAYKHIDPTLTTVSIIDARRDEVYLAAYRFSPGQGQIETIIPPGLFSIHRLKELLEPLGHIHFVGSGAETYRSFLKQNFKHSKIRQRSFFLASEICKIVYDNYLKKENLTDLQQLLPFYIRKPDAEQNFPHPRNPDIPKTP
jgi:tRNA threonylcarbamoyladenosine biosynthesis protein TsaB